MHRRQRNRGGRKKSPRKKQNRQGWNVYARRHREQRMLSAANANANNNIAQTAAAPPPPPPPPPPAPTVNITTLNGGFNGSMIMGNAAHTSSTTTHDQHDASSHDTNTHTNTNDASVNFDAAATIGNHVANDLNVGQTQDVDEDANETEEEDADNTDEDDEDDEDAVMGEIEGAGASGAEGMEQGPGMGSNDEEKRNVSSNPNSSTPTRALVTNCETWASDGVKVQALDANDFDDFETLLLNAKMSIYQLESELPGEIESVRPCQAAVYLIRQFVAQLKNRADDRVAAFLNDGGDGMELD